VVILTGDSCGCFSGDRRDAEADFFFLFFFNFGFSSCFLFLFLFLLASEGGVVDIDLFVEDLTALLRLEEDLVVFAALVLGMLVVLLLNETKSCLGVM